jgi:drug/metabolite transporter (DMT)-like permease
MLYLALSLIFSTSIFAIFKLFEKNKVENLDAIIVNYFVAFTTGLLFVPQMYTPQIAEQSWFPFAIIIGILFISLFNIMALTAQQMGISVASVSNKMAVVIPVCFAFFAYGDSVTFFKIAGIVLALAGVYLVSQRKQEESTRKNYLLPAILFFGSGVLDTLIKYTQTYHLEDGSDLMFIPLLFLIAGSLGYLYKVIYLKQFRISGKSLLWGLILGVPNYFSIYFLVKTLQLPNWESSVIFPINNLGIVSLSFITALIFFKERYSKFNWLGFLISLIGIGLIAL